MIPWMIADALRDGAKSRAFLALLEDYGKWARDKGIQGYRSGHTPQPYLMDDDTGLIVDRAMQRLKDTRPKLYELMAAFFIQELSVDDLSAPRGKKRHLGITHTKNFYGVDLSQYEGTDYLTSSDVVMLLNFAMDLIFNFLREVFR